MGPIPSLFTSSHRDTVLVSSGCSNKVSVDWGLKSQTWSCHHSGGWKSKIKVPAVSVPGESSVSVSPPSGWGEGRGGEWECSGVSSSSQHNNPHNACRTLPLLSSDLSSSQKPLLLIPLNWGSGLQHLHLEEWGHKQTLLSSF